MSSGPRSLFIASLLLMLVLQGAFHTAALLTDGDSDGAHLHHGWLIVRGELGLYADSMSGHRTPLPYWLVGLSQILFGPSVLAGRAFSLLAGWAGVLVLWFTSRRALGEPAGTLTLLLLATNAYLMAHFSVAAFHGLAFFWVALGAWFLVASAWRWRREAVVLCAWGLFLTRPQFGLCVPLAGAWAMIEARDRRWPVLAALTLPGAVFLAAYWPGVLKMAAYVPGLAGWAAGHGWVSVPNAMEPDWGTRIGRAAALALRSYKAWIALGLLGWVLWPLGYPPLHRKAKVLLWAFLALAASQLMVVNFSWKVAVGYFPAFAGLLAMPLAARFAQLLAQPENCPAGKILPRRAVAAVVLAGALLIGPAWSPPPNLPLRVDPARLAALEAERAGRELARLIPRGTPVFLFGPATVPHLAGLRPPIQPANHLETLQGSPDAPTLRRSGLWGTADIADWLAREPRPYAILWRDGLVARVDRYGWQAPAALMLALLERHYAPAGMVAYHGIVLEVFRRKS